MPRQEIGGVIGGVGLDVVNTSVLNFREVVLGFLPEVAGYTLGVFMANISSYVLIGRVKRFVITPI